jgi:Holliday junction resolvasome RuvABC DNA-binding subunit
LARDPVAEQGPAAHAELVAALSDMGYDRKAASDAILKAASELGTEAGGPEHEKALFKRAIVLLSGM